MTSGSGSAAELIGHQRRQVGTVEAREVQAVDPLSALELREIGEERAGRVGLVGPDGGDRQDALVTQVPGEERHEVACRRVRPLQVLDDQHDGRDARQPLQHP